MSNFDELFEHPKQSTNIEQNLTYVMDMGLAAARTLRPDVPVIVLKSMIISHNLKALVEVLMLADDDENPEYSLDLKKVCLGLLATSDWIMPDFDMEATPVFPPEANGHVE